jgi:hypothetical protein
LLLLSLNLQEFVCVGKITGFYSHHFYWNVDLIQNLSFEIVVHVLLYFLFSPYCLGKPMKWNFNVTPEITKSSFVGHGRQRVLSRGQKEQ